MFSNFIRLRNLVIVLIVISTFLKLSLIGKGFLHYSDENRYTASGIALRAFHDGDIKEGLGLLFSTKGRPGSAIINLIPNIIQISCAKILDLYIYEPSNSISLFIFNYVVYVLLLFLHFKFSKLLFKNDLYCYCSVLFFSCLTNSYVYLRHAVPYDFSLLIIYFCLYKIILNIKKESLTNKDLIGFGFLAFFGYLTYPGYVISFFLIPFVVLLYKINYQKFKQKIRQIMFFGLGALICLSLFEVLAFFGGKSYIKSSIVLSKTITQGDFSETYVFLTKYLINVENINGILILLIWPFGFYFILKQLKDNFTKSPVAIIIFYLIISYGIIGTLGYFFNKIVLYGRIIHQFYPFLCIFFIYTIDLLLEKKNKLKNWVIITSSLLFFVSYTVNINNYLSYRYPKDTLWEICKSFKYENISEYSEFINQDYFPYKPLKKSLNNSSFSTKTDSIKIINSFYLMPVGLIKSYDYKPKAYEKLIKKFNHIANFKPYQYEGMHSCTRKYFSKNIFQIKVYKY